MAFGSRAEAESAGPFDVVESTSAAEPEVDVAGNVTAAPYPPVIVGKVTVAAVAPTVAVAADVSGNAAVEVAPGVGVDALGIEGVEPPPPPPHEARSSDAERMNAAPAGAILLPMMVIRRSNADSNRDG